MPWLKTVGCDCPECGPDPCTEGCECFVSAGYLPIAFDDYLDVTGSFIIEHELAIDITATGTCNPLGGGPPTLVSWVIKVWANGSLIFDTGCTTDGSYSTSVMVPAGTTELHFQGFQDCSFGCESGEDGEDSVYFTCI